ncbi:MAG: type II toxin-antitoxin system Phd/YefM family antitoxin [Candidatus Wildermuthbacteria bacterium]|nr:type II toxin-antitoxin system Phd/YefM family antitoxin [Candidatus Wildermuthbacteria bacterium]
MDSKRTISVSEARKRIFEIIDEVQKPDAYYTLTENGKPKAVILSAENFEDLLDDLDIYSDPDLLKEIQEAEREYKNGEYISLEELKKEFGVRWHEALAVREEGKEKYGIRSVIKKKKSARKKV